MEGLSPLSVGKKSTNWEMLCNKRQEEKEGKESDKGEDGLWEPELKGSIFEAQVNKVFRTETDVRLGASWPIEKREVLIL